MLKKTAIYMVGAAMLCATAACNDDDTNYEFSMDYASTMVKSFSLQPNNKILNHLDSIYFSIDLVNARIFNADSLPYGTNTSRLQVSITTDGCSTVELHYPRANKPDSVVNYLEHSSDSIDFSLGAVKLHVVSYDKRAERDYLVQVNVHNVVSDSLTWDLKSPTKLPSSLSAPRYQRTVQYAGKVYTLTTSGARQACMAIGDTPASTSVNKPFTFDFTPDVNTLTATTTALYILSYDGELYSSADGCSWTSCGVVWKSITAPYGSTLLGLAETNGQLMHVSYPAGLSTPAKANFPVKGNSQPISYSTDWGLAPQIITLGGLQADGKATPTAWAYDGSQWACIDTDTPFEGEGIALFPYYSCSTDTNTWVATSRSVLVAMGGRNPKHEMQDTVYISYDLGFNWSKAPSLMQQPKALPKLYDSQIIVSNETKHSRAIRPITEWDTPYIYMYGGYTSNGILSDRVYRGVINRLSFKPIQ
ncbi:MAG: DUF6242 domain-containing protein [Clostridiales bacterium]|nr:DUF6242 domain-containing protein [Clostridiales bacterium]